MTTTSTTARMASIWRASRGLERCPPLPPRGPPHSAPGDRRAAALRSPAPRVAGEGGAGACVHPPRCASATGAPCRGARGPARARRAPPERAPAPSRRCSLARTGGRADQAAGERARAAQVGCHRRPAARAERQAVQGALQEPAGPQHQARAVVGGRGCCHLQGAEVPGQSVDRDRKVPPGQVLRAAGMPARVPSRLPAHARSCAQLAPAADCRVASHALTPTLNARPTPPACAGRTTRSRTTGTRRWRARPRRCWPTTPRIPVITAVTLTPPSRPPVSAPLSRQVLARVRARTHASMHTRQLMKNFYGGSTGGGEGPLVP